MAQTLSLSPPAADPNGTSIFGPPPTKDITLQTKVPEPYFSSEPHTIPKPTRDDKKSIANPSDKDLAEVQTVTLTESVMKHPVQPKASSNPADYYRRGGPVRNTNVTSHPGKKQIVFNPNTGSYDTVFQEPNYDSDDGVYYRDPQPRTLNDQPEESIASIRLIGKTKKDSKAKPTDLIPPYSKIFLEAVQEGHAERSQVVETFGDFFVFFYGERPPTYNFSGTLLNSADINWVEDFYFYYDNFLRGTKCVEYGAVLVITYGYRQIEGYLLSMNMNINAVSANGVPVSFQILVTDRKVLKLSNDFGIIESSDNTFYKDKSILEMLKQGMSSGTASDARAATDAVVNKKKGAHNTRRKKKKDITALNDKYKVSPTVANIEPNPSTGGIQAIINETIASYKKG